jgi:beta-lactamase class A
MKALLSRRQFAVLGASAGACASLAACTPKVKLTPHSAASAQAKLALEQLEQTNGGRLGVGFLVPATGMKLGHRSDERFGMASSFKMALAAIVLREADQGRLSLQTQLPIQASDMVPNSAVFQENLPKGVMSIEALAKAAQTTSDNAATNILLRHLGGPSVFTAKLRELGDEVTRLDRLEPAMMTVTRDDARDTTTPDAMTKTTAAMLTTDWLTPTSRDLLINWMVETRTGLKRIRAGLPTDWRAGDKTGTTASDDPSQPDRYNDIAIAWPPSKPPIIVTCYYESPVKSENMRDEDQAVLAQVGRIAAAWYQG